MMLRSVSGGGLGAVRPANSARRRFAAVLLPSEENEDTSAAFQNSGFAIDFIRIPKHRCTPAHAKQTKVPCWMEAHSGEGSPQSAHSTLSFCLLSESRDRAMSAEESPICTPEYAVSG